MAEVIVVRVSGLIEGIERFPVAEDMPSAVIVHMVTEPAADLEPPIDMDPTDPDPPVDEDPKDPDRPAWKCRMSSVYVRDCPNGSVVGGLVFGDVVEEWERAEINGNIWIRIGVNLWCAWEYNHVRFFEEYL